jgi:putative CocE/NonD family hydrolase
MKPGIIEGTLFFCAALTVSLGTRAGTPRASDEKQNLAVVILDVPMRDGVKLRADLLRPASGGPFPVLVYRTPYGRKSAETYYTTFRHAVERGYAVLIQDVRGRYDSEGEFRPYENEGHDGFDTIEWAAKQNWSNGEVGTFGLSYPGAVQWLAAVENPPHLRAMVPAMTFSTPQNFFYAGGSWDLSWIEWIWDNIAPDISAKKNVIGAKTGSAARKTWKQDGDKMLAEVPLKNLAELRGLAPYYYDWLSHPPEDPWWDWAELRNKYSNVHAAVLNLSAWYDDNYGPEGATTNFNGLIAARKLGDARTHLLLGPWVHGGTEESKAGERIFSPAAAIDYDETVLRWMDHYLRNMDNGVEREAPARYFVMGKEAWRESQTWPPATKMTSYYLTIGSNTDSSTTRVGLAVTAPVSQKSSSSFMSDPEHPVTNKYAASGAHDYRDLVGRADTLTFDSPALQSDVEVTGSIDAEIYMSCDCRDADLWVRLLDVGPDGTAFNLMSPGLDVVRASYRSPERGRQLLQPSRIYQIGLKNLITSNVFKVGHRIRVQVSGSFFPNFSRNPQTGESERDSATMKKSRITIHADRHHPSRIILPVAN